jgi:glucose/arabinose dehydrogenase
MSGHWLRRAVVSVALLVVSAGVLSACHGHPHAKAVITGLEFPAAFTLDPNNQAIWYGERNTGEIRRRNLQTGQDTLVWTVTNVLTAGEQGLLGIALHPNYPQSPFLYAYASRNVNGARNHILRITIFNGVGISSQVILNDPGIGAFHNGGRIKFGPDGNLFAVIGEHGNAANAQIVNANTNLAGKVLRMTPTGGVPSDNPFPGSLVWARGIRNSYGFGFDPVTDGLWLTDNGPSCNDEVNRIIRSGNYSWGAEATCASPPPAPQNTNQSGTGRIQPLAFYPAQGITGLAFCDGCGLSATFEDRAFFSTVNNGQLHSLTLNAARTAIANDTVVYDHPSGILSIESRPGRPVYFSTANAIYRFSYAD